MCQLHIFCFEVPVNRQITRTHTQTQTRNCAHVGMQKHKLVASENFICVFPTWRPCELLNWAGPLDPRFGVHTENLLPVKHFTTHTYTSTSFLFFFSHVPATPADVTLSGVPQFISCCFQRWGHNRFVSFTDKTQYFSGTFSLLKCIIRLFCSTSLFVIQTDDTDDEGEWSNYVMIYSIILSRFDWQMVGIVNNKCDLS